MNKRTYILGLTGSIGMGKSTTAKFFRLAGVPVWDADASVHELYTTGGAGVRAIEVLAPTAIRDGAVDRKALRQAVLDDKGLLKRIEEVVHPLVSADRQNFLDLHVDEPLVACDIPLLYETGADAWLDGVLIVSASKDVQEQRVMDREGMTREVFETMLAKQTPDAEKRQRADYMIDTGLGLDHAQAEVLSLIERLKGK
ncbi:dephospho-CoA kinase [Rhodobacterales bacterium 52_120_T64]|nr:dephospho-CoA kinase [Rhodobacterales bacterium 52_120_T64]